MSLARRHYPHLRSSVWLVVTAMLLSTATACKKETPSAAEASASVSPTPVPEKPEQLMPADHLLAVGEPAPPLSALAHTGNWVRLRDFLQRPLALVFPAGETDLDSIAQALRDNWLPMNERLSTVMIFSSRDTVSLRESAYEHELPMLLVSDTDGSIRQAFGVTPAHKTAVFVVGKDGKIVAAGSSLDAAAVVRTVAKSVGL